MKIAYLGPENSYSHLAAKKAAKEDGVLIPKPAFPDVFDAVRAGAADAAVIPVENSVEGNVNEVTDRLIFNAEPLFINAEFTLKIDNYLIARETADFNKIETVITHRQPYGQCRETLRRLYPAAKIIFADSTSAAEGKLSDEKTAAVGGKQLLSKSLKISENSVNDNDENRTRFAVISKTDAPDKESNKLSIAFEAENKPGGLLRLLQIINAHNLNMTRIESRPHKSVLGRYVFIADLAGNVLEADTAAALKELKADTAFFKYLGCYKALN